MTTLIRAAALQGYEAAARSIGMDPLAELCKVNLSISNLIETDNFIAYQAFIRLLENTAHAGKCPDFGLKLAQHQTAFLEGPLTLLMRHAETLKAALSMGAQYGHIFSPVMRTSLVPVPDQSHLVDVTVIVNDGTQTACSQTTEFVLLGVLNVLRWLTNNQLRPQQVLIPHARMGSSAHYAKYLDCECRFDTPFAAVRIASAELDTALPGRNALLMQMAQSYIEQHFGTSKNLVTDRVRTLLRQLMAMGRVSQTDIASALSLHPKTMQRRLAREGQRFDNLLDTVRRDRFLELLMQSTQPSLAHIALMVGYCEHSVLTRSCHRWFGCSPRELRQRQQATLHAPPSRHGP